PGDLAVALADAVRGGAEAKRERGDAEGLAEVAAAHPTELEQPGDVGAELLVEVAENLEDLAGTVRLVARRDRGVGGEDGVPAGERERLVERGAAGDRPPRHLERRERRVALVEVEDAGLDAHRPQRPQPADAEHGVLG